jgi:hypothetical protein
MKTEFYCFGCQKHKSIEFQANKKNCKECLEKIINSMSEQGQHKRHIMNKKNTKHYKNPKLIEKTIKYLVKL